MSSKTIHHRSTLYKLHPTIFKHFWSYWLQKCHPIKAKKFLQLTIIYQFFILFIFSIFSSKYRDRKCLWLSNSKQPFWVIYSQWTHFLGQFFCKQRQQQNETWAFHNNFSIFQPRGKIPDFFVTFTIHFSQFFFSFL